MKVDRAEEESYRKAFRLYVNNDSSLPKNTHWTCKKFKCKSFTDACRAASVNVKTATNYLNHIRKAVFPNWDPKEEEKEWWVRGHEEEILTAIDSWSLARLGNENFKQPWFDDAELDGWAQLLATTSSLGFPLERDEFLAKVNMAVREKAEQRSTKFRPVGETWFYNFLKRDYSKELGLYTGKTSTIDVQRADQANVTTRDEFFDLLDSVTKDYYAKYDTFEWNSWADIPDRFRYNMDESKTRGTTT
jgi:hypothetical protein